MKKISTIALYSFLALALAFGLVALPARAADHLDGPMAKHDGRLDITDVYAFQSPTNPANTVLIMNVDPVAGVLSPTTFHPDASYDFKIDTNGDAKEDITYKVTFSAVSNGSQNVQLRRVPARGSGAVLARGQTGTNISVSGGGMLRVGVFDDPFFFDLVAFRNGLAFCPGGIGTNFFAGLNVASSFWRFLAPVWVPISASGRAPRWVGSKLIAWDDQRSTPSSSIQTQARTLSTLAFQVTTSATSTKTCLTHL